MYALQLEKYITFRKTDTQTAPACNYITLEFLFFGFLLPMAKGTNWPAVDFDFLKKKFDYPYCTIFIVFRIEPLPRCSTASRSSSCPALHRGQEPISASVIGSKLRQTLKVANRGSRKRFNHIPSLQMNNKSHGGKAGGNGSRASSRDDDWPKTTSSRLSDQWEADKSSRLCGGLPG